MAQIEDTRTVDTATDPDSLTGSGSQGDSSAAPVTVVAEDELLIEDVSIDGMCGVY